MRHCGERTGECCAYMRLQPPVLAAPNHFGSLVIYKHVKQRLSATVRSPGTAGLCAPPLQAAQT